MARQSNPIIATIIQLHDQVPDRDQLADPIANQRVLDLARRRVELERAMELSESTKQRYLEVSKRFIRLDGGKHLEDLCQTDKSAGEIIGRFESNTNSAGVCRGAIRHLIAKTHFQMILGEHERGRLSIEKAGAYAHSLFQGLRKVEPIARDNSTTSWFIGDGLGRKEKSSKRRHLPRDPHWREGLWSLVDRNDSRYKSALAVIDYTGIRPEELATGVAVSLAPGDCGKGVLIFDIITAKRQDGATRSLITKIGPEDGSGQFLADQIRAAGKSITVVLDAKATKTLSGRIRTWGKTFGWSVSCYSYRHALGDDLRSRRDPRLLAIALGHASTNSQRHYGATAGGRGGRRQARDLLIDAKTNIEPIIIERQFDKMGLSQNIGEDLEATEDADDLVADPVD